MHFEPYTCRLTAYKHLTGNQTNDSDTPSCVLSSSRSPGRCLLALLSLNVSWVLRLFCEVLSAKSQFFPKKERPSSNSESFFKISGTATSKCSQASSAVAHAASDTVLTFTVVPATVTLHFTLSIFLDSKMMEYPWATVSHCVPFIEE